MNDSLCNTAALIEGNKHHCNLRIINKVTLSLLDAYIVNPVSLTPMAYSRFRDVHSVRHPSFEAYPWFILS
jgi:hypothetical protein